MTVNQVSMSRQWSHRWDKSANKNVDGWVLTWHPAILLHWFVNCRDGDAYIKFLSTYFIRYLNQLKTGVVVVPTLSPLVVPQVVVTTTCGPANDDKVGIMTILCFFIDGHTRKFITAPVMQLNNSRPRCHSVNGRWPVIPGAPCPAALLSVAQQVKYHGDQTCWRLTHAPRTWPDAEMARSCDAHAE